MSVPLRHRDNSEGNHRYAKNVIRLNGILCRKDKTGLHSSYILSGGVMPSSPNPLLRISATQWNRSRRAA